MLVDFFNNVRSSSYVVFDSVTKYAYDRYNDVYRYCPLNDIADCCKNRHITDSALTCKLNRGVIRGAAKLAFNPTKSQRDDFIHK